MERTLQCPYMTRNIVFVKTVWRLHIKGTSCGSEHKESACNVGDLSSIPGSGRSPGEEYCNPLQYSCLENPFDRKAWWATVNRVIKSRTKLSDFTSPYLSITNSQSLLKLRSIELVMPSNCLILCHTLLLPPSIIPSIRVFSNESVLRIRWPEYWGFSFSISPSNDYSVLISFRIDWLDLLAVQGTLKSLLQHHNSKASLFRAQFSSWFNSHIHTWLLEKP